MNRSLSLVAAIVSAIPVAWSIPASAQLQQDPLGMMQAEPGAPKLVEGKVADVQRAGPMVTMLRLDDGTELVVPAGSRAPGPDVVVGTAVAARYVDRGDDKITTLLRATGVEAP